MSIRVREPSQAGLLGMFRWGEETFKGQELHTEASSSEMIRGKKQRFTEKCRNTAGGRPKREEIGKE